MRPRRQTPRLTAAAAEGLMLRLREGEGVVATGAGLKALVAPLGVVMGVGVAAAVLR